MKDKILFLDSKTTPRTFNALEAKLGTKNQKKKIQRSCYIGNNLMYQEKQNKTERKENMGCLTTSAFLLRLLARHDNFNDALIRIRVGT